MRAIAIGGLCLLGGVMLGLFTYLMMEGRPKDPPDEEE